MKIGAPKEIVAGEARVAMTPESAGRLQKLGHSCVIETGAGLGAQFSDQAYKDAGVEVVKTAAALWKAADVVVKVRPPEPAEVKRTREGQLVIASIYPAQNEALLGDLNKAGANVIAMGYGGRVFRGPRRWMCCPQWPTSRDIARSLRRATILDVFFTGQITAAGKVPPAKVLVVGAGVAGLRPSGPRFHWGAITYAFDVRPEVAEQIESMGAEFVFLDFEEAAQDGAETGGYAAPSPLSFAKSSWRSSANWPLTLIL